MDTPSPGRPSAPFSLDSEKLPHGFFCEDKCEAFPVCVCLTALLKYNIHTITFSDVYCLMLFSSKFTELWNHPHNPILHRTHPPSGILLSLLQPSICPLGINNRMFIAVSPKYSVWNSWVRWPGTESEGLGVVAGLTNFNR